MRYEAAAVRADLRAKEVGQLETKHLLTGKTGQARGQGIGVDDRLGFGVEQKQRIAGFLEEGLSEFGPRRRFSSDAWLQRS